MKENILNLLGKRILFFDGGMGSLLQERGLKAGEIPEIWNITRPQVLTEIHKEYLEAGADIILTNTFGGNRLKLAGSGHSTDEVVAKAAVNAQNAVEICGKQAFVALDIGPTGKLLKPLGDLSFDQAYDIFKEMVVAGEKAGVDLIHIETMSDTYELKAAVLAAKENTSLPVFATATFDEKGKLLTGGNVKTVVALLEGLGVDALGINCGLGPEQTLPIAEEMLAEASIPVILNPNAGLPRTENGQTVYDITPKDFAEIMKKSAEAGAWVLGGCCGTTPENIKYLKEACQGIRPKPIEPKNKTVVCSYSTAVEIGQRERDSVIIGERINPTGKSAFKQALRESNIDYILQEGFKQQDKGAHILDVNVGLPEIDEPEMMVNVVRELQSVIDLPLQIDTSSTEAMEKALRYYNGKALINSVNGKAESMEAVFPLVKKYGGAVVGLTLDEGGIPDTPEGRFKIAEKIVKTAQTYGINKKDIIIDVLCMTISSDRMSAMTTLEALKMVKKDLGVATILGVSNISFGLPQREKINQAFYTMTLFNGLDCAIINPNSQAMMNAYYAYRALAGVDENCADYIREFSGAALEPSKLQGTQPEGSGEASMTLGQAIERGMKEQAGRISLEILKEMEPLDVINAELIPALDKVGKGFEQGKVFLPQLLMSAEAAKSAFESIKQVMASQGKTQSNKGKVIIATVKGDIHDIGKNIVKVLLENYSFQVLDLGKDVLPEKVVETAVAEDVKLIGLSALMTTTVANMEETIRQLRRVKPDCRIMVGGAVLTDKYAEMINADYYAKDAMSSVYYAQKILAPAEEK